MRESVTEQCRVQDESLRSVNCCQGLATQWADPKEGPAKFVPAAAVIRTARALRGLIGLKAYVGGRAGVL